nr:hypothetical protein [Methylosinus sp. Ce-a6]
MAADRFDLHTFQNLKQRPLVGDDRPNVTEAADEGPLPLIGPLQQGRLGRGRQHDGGSVIARQLVERQHDGTEHGQRQGLRFVQNDHRSRDIVQLAASRILVVEQALEELRRCRHHDRRIPILLRQFQLVAHFRRVALAADFGVVEGAVMLQHGTLELAERLAVDIGRLLHHRGERNHHDDPVEIFRNRMIERKGERDQRLAASGRHGESENTLAGLRAGAGRGEDRGAGVVQWPRPLTTRPFAFCRQKVVEPSLQIRERNIDDGSRGFGNELLSGDEIRVHQRRERHAGKEREAKRGARLLVVAAGFLTQSDRRRARRRRACQPCGGPEAFLPFQISHAVL